MACEMDEIELYDDSAREVEEGGRDLEIALGVEREEAAEAQVLEWTRGREMVWVDIDNLLVDLEGTTQSLEEALERALDCDVDDPEEVLTWNELRAIEEFLFLCDWCWTWRRVELMRGDDEQQWCALCAARRAAA